MPPTDLHADVHPTWAACPCGQDVLIVAASATCLACHTSVERQQLVVGICLLCERHGPLTPHDTGHLLCDRHDTSVRASRSHSAHAALTGRCACQQCLDRVEQARGWVRERMEGVALADIGARNGITRERVRQITEQVAPAKPWDAAKLSWRIDRDTIEAIRDQGDVPCPVCPDGRVPLRSNRRYCRDRCREVHETLAWHIDEGRRESNRRAMARWVLSKGDEQTASERAHARRVLAGEGPEDPNRRRFHENSETFRVALEAHRDGWPIAQRLPAVLRDQLDAHLERDDTSEAAA